jgi:hypothetical protein
VINARTISYVLLASSVCTILYAVFVGEGLPLWLVFALGAAIIFSFGIQTLRVLWEQRRSRLSQCLPRMVQISLLIVAAVGGLLFVVTLSGAMPSKTPSGLAVSSYNAETVAGVCRFTYNMVEVVVRPIGECRAFEKTVSLIIAGSFLLFSAVGVWLAHLESGFKGRGIPNP